MSQGNKVATSFRLSPVALDLIAQLTEKLGVSQAGVVEMAVRKLAQQESLTPKGQQHDSE